MLFWSLPVIKDPPLRHHSAPLQTRLSFRLPACFWKSTSQQWSSSWLVAHKVQLTPIFHWYSCSSSRCQRDQLILHFLYLLPTPVPTLSSYHPCLEPPLRITPTRFQVPLQKLPARSNINTTCFCPAPNTNYPKVYLVLLQRAESGRELSPNV